MDGIVQKLSTTVLNARKIVINPLSKDAEEYLGSEIDSLFYKELDIKIQCGKELEINKRMYKPLYIQRQNITQGEMLKGYHIIMHMLSKTANFILPLLGGTRSKFRWYSNFCNAFIGTEEEGDYGSFIYLMYKFDGSIEFLEFEKELLDHPNYVETLDYDIHHSVYVFSLEGDDKEAYDTLISGNYSKIEDKYKEKILAFHSTNRESLLGQVLYKSPIRRAQLEELYNVDSIDEDTELFSKFKEDQEILLNKYYINYEPRRK